MTKFEIEAESIRIMRESNTLFVPEVILTGKSKHNSFIILNYLPTKQLDDDKKTATCLVSNWPACISGGNKKRVRFRSG
ncbi:fructosamine kinase family protein [Vibrio sinaloensis]|nr:fructosamine kinase family protein [Vibrio sinaloensis]